MLGTRRRLRWIAPVLALSLLRAEARALAQGEPDPLVAARALFAEALRDEKAKRYDAALDKFQRVQRVKDTAAIEYRIGTCYEALGKPALAFVAYRSAVTLGESTSTAPPQHGPHEKEEAAMAEVVRGARVRLDALSQHLARLTLSMPRDPPADAAVRVDDAAVPVESLGAPLPLEPGDHVVVATAEGATPFRTEITLPEGGQATLALAFAPLAKPGAAALVAPPPVVPSSAGKGRQRTWGWVALGAGGALAAGSVVTLLLRQGDISSLDRQCPGGSCPPGANQSALESTRSRALAEGPIAAVLAGAALVGLGLGAYLVWTAAGARVTVAPAGDGRGAGATLAGKF
jgi:hypothetical protein